MLCEAKSFGGDDDVELVWEPWGKGLLDRTEGLVLLGLGLVAMVSCVVTLSGRVSQGQRARPEGCDGQPRAALAGSGRRDEHAPETKRERSYALLETKGICERAR